MISVVFVWALSGLGRAIGSVKSLAERLPGRKPFEISQDGEYLFTDSARYDFVGFSPREYYQTPSGERAVPGRRIGYVFNDDGSNILELNMESEVSFCGERYVMLSGMSDLAEIYRLHA
ncbi:MAG: hypothetical protein E7559_09860 [Ruminococcaceae bacterium]|nr:hypothetical protein [Oscillospiraceae bacterium]